PATGRAPAQGRLSACAARDLHNNGAPRREPSGASKGFQGDRPGTRRSVMMKFKHLAGIGAATLLTMGLAVPAAAQSASAALKGANGQDIGSVPLAQTPAGGLAKVLPKGLAPGGAGLHLS